MKIFTETERLILREIIPEDIEGFFELDSDPDVHKYLGNRPVVDREELKMLIDKIRQQYIDTGIGRWAIIEKSTNSFAGWSGLKLVREKINDHTDYYDLGYRLIRRFWGKGIATESAMASLTYGFDTLKLKEIYAAAHIENKASNRILNKIGFSYIETFDYDGSKHNWYKIERGNG